MKRLLVKCFVKCIAGISPYAAQVFWIGLLCAPISAFMFFLANEETRRCEQFDASPERVSVADFLERKYSNRHWFELTDFQVGAEYFASGDDSSSEEAIYLPVWPRSADQANGPAPLTAQVHNVPKNKREETIDRISRGTTIPIQFWNTVNTHVAQMHKSDPTRWSRHPVVVDINYERPTRFQAWMYRLWGGLWAVVSVVALGFTFLIHLDILGIGKPRARKSSFQTQAASKESVGLFSTNSLSLDFCRLGFQASNTIRETAGRTTKDHHLHLSADSRLVLDLIETKQGTFPFLFAVCSDGTLLVLRPGEEAVDLDGAEFGVPIRVRGTQDFHPQRFIETFHSWKKTLSAVESLVYIPANEVASVHQYYDRLIDWWLVFMGKSQNQPAAIPARDELIHELDGNLVFCWGAKAERAQNEYTHA